MTGEPRRHLQRLLGVVERGAGLGEIAGGPGAGDEAENALQKVVEVVCDAASEGAQRLEFLRLEPLGFGEPALGQVREQGQHARAPVELDARAAQVDLDHRAVLAEHGEGRFGLRAGRLAREGGGDISPRLRRVQVGDSQGQQLLRRVAQ